MRVGGGAARNAPRPHSFFLDRGSAAKTLITQYTILPAAQATRGTQRMIDRFEDFLVEFLCRVISVAFVYSNLVFFLLFIYKRTIF